jgi:hypothetical protein
MKMKLGLIFENKIVEMKFEKVISNIKIILYHIIKSCININENNVNKSIGFNGS